MEEETPINEVPAPFSEISKANQGIIETKTPPGENEPLPTSIFQDDIQNNSTTVPDQGVENLPQVTEEDEPKQDTLQKQEIEERPDSQPVQYT